MPRAGKLRKRVTFATEIRASDGQGGVTKTWQDVMTVWGGYTPERGSEAVKQGRLQGSNSGVLEVRYSQTLADLTAAARVTIDGQKHQIRSVTQPDQNNKLLEFVVERGVAPHG